MAALTSSFAFLPCMPKYAYSAPSTPGKMCVPAGDPSDCCTDSMGAPESNVHSTLPLEASTATTRPSSRPTVSTSSSGLHDTHNWIAYCILSHSNESQGLRMASAHLSSHFLDTPAKSRPVRGCKSAPAAHSHSTRHRSTGKERMVVGFTIYVLAWARQLHCIMRRRFFIAHARLPACMGSPMQENGFDNSVNGVDIK